MALTKQLKFDQDVLSVLRGLAWSEDGLSAVITQQLDRKLYEKVNKALDAMGGAWNKKAKAHLFPTDPRAQVEGLLESGALTVERDGFFQTPKQLVAWMLIEVDLFPGAEVLEPSAGLGAIAREILGQEPGVRLTLVEKNRSRYEALYQEFHRMAANVYNADFLSFFPDEKYDLVLMNPPFEEGQDADHVRHAYKFLKPGGRLVAIMGEGIFFRNDSKATSFREWFDLVYGNSEKLPEGTFKESGTGVNTRMVVITK